MDYYIYNPGGPDRGPFTFEQLQTKLASGHLHPKTRIRSGTSADCRPLSEVTDSPPESGEHVATSNRFADYFVLIDEKERGPYTEVQLRSMWMAGSLTGEMLYRHGYSQEWSPLSDMRYQLESAVQIQESAAKIQAEKITKTAQPKTASDMFGYSLLAILLPIVGLIIGIVWLSQPGKKHEQGVMLIIVSVVAFFVWLLVWPNVFG